MIKITKEYNQSLSCIIEWEETTLTLTFTRFSTSGKIEEKIIIEGCVSFEEARKILKQH